MTASEARELASRPDRVLEAVSKRAWGGFKDVKWFGPLPQATWRRLEELGYEIESVTQRCGMNGDDTETFYVIKW